MLTLSRAFHATLMNQQSSIVPMWPRPPPLSGFVLPRKKTRPTTDVLPFRATRQLNYRPPPEYMRRVPWSRRSILPIRRPSIESEPDAEEVPVEPGTTYRPPPEYLRRVPWSRRSVLPIRRPSIESEPDTEEVPVEPGTTPATVIAMQPQRTPRLSFLPRPRNLFDSEVVAEEVPQPPTTNTRRIVISFEYTSYFRPRNPRRESMFFGYALEPEETAVEVQPEPEQQPLTTDEDEYSSYYRPRNPRHDSKLFTEETAVAVQSEPEPQHDDNFESESAVEPEVVVEPEPAVTPLRRSPRLALKPRVDYTKFF
jgi:hypothetical protein